MIRRKEMKTMIENGLKMWNVMFDHKDGRKGFVMVITEIFDSGANSYGNRKGGRIIVNKTETIYDLRYVHDRDLHAVMIEEYFGDGLVNAIPC